VNISGTPGEADGVAPPGDAPRVVVVDDTAEVLELMVSVLADEGYAVVGCQDATRATATILQETPALVILDLRMAGVGDWQVLEELRAEPRTAAVPIIICSGAVEELRAAQAALKGRGCEILTKPFDIEVLIQRVERLIGPPGG
jgi:CheY-like chemotaxis protein